jgi:hypothetical protein
MQVITAQGQSTPGLALQANIIVTAAGEPAAVRLIAHVQFGDCAQAVAQIFRHAEDDARGVVHHHVLSAIGTRRTGGSAGQFVLAETHFENTADGHIRATRGERDARYSQRTGNCYCH